MNLKIDHLALPEALKAPSIPIHPLLTPSLDDPIANAALLQNDPSPTSADTKTDAAVAAVSTIPSTAVSTTAATFPVRIASLPNKGRSYVATRTIQPNELVFVAEAYGTTMCDPWLDCGVCHYCWTTIPNRKTQIRLPTKSDDTNGKPKNRNQDTAMVFCDETCLRLYGPATAKTICRVEEKVRRTWNDSGMEHCKITMSSVVKPTGLEGEQGTSSNGSISVAAVAAIATATDPRSIHYSTLVLQALSIAHTRQELLNLSDQDLACFLNCLWSALDGIIDEQESSVDTMEPPSSSSSSPQQPGYDLKPEALFPTLATYLLQGDNHATIAAQTSDDDCEITRLITEVLHRRQTEMQAHLLPSPSTASQVASVDHISAAAGIGPSRVPGERTMFADYCAMQSNELVMFRQQLRQDMTEQEQLKQEQLDQHQESKAIPHKDAAEWRRLLALVPAHLLGCFYIYLRLRDACLLLALENSSSSSPSGPSAMNPSTTTPSLSINNTLFRTILFGEVANSFGIRDASDELIGFAVFPRACFFNHSCCPNVQKQRRQGDRARQMEYWSTRLIEEGEECCISYGDITTSKEDRQERLWEMYFFRCSCPRCLEEEEEHTSSA
ncbi:hypothetical protein BC939DRAFT_502519 [Gamsiella multidivaricata]|uniref:uncharacterized protein n=1 Tax=Gamsiella multidivaricata TaxID=101098 RepID=UPI00221EA1E5|nr:uncharacterized protein BC939DRAFT_502519 [Gamsiella multidivaricata]KAG0355250.1 hypothetical protein BGZ54_001244 [Gamsiella multidivaricata]KAI7824802.1 hypothetical protein BC939DRAFT_502519 [Gamsiella multidivaricata]